MIETCGACGIAGYRDPTNTFIPIVQRIAVEDGERIGACVVCGVERVHVELQSLSVHGGKAHAILRLRSADESATATFHREGGMSLPTMKDHYERAGKPYGDTDEGYDRWCADIEDRFFGSQPRRDPRDLHRNDPRSAPPVNDQRVTPQ